MATEIKLHKLSGPEKQVVDVINPKSNLEFQEANRIMDEAVNKMDSKAVDLGSKEGFMHWKNLLSKVLKDGKYNMAQKLILASGFWAAYAFEVMFQSSQKAHEKTSERSTPKGVVERYKAENKDWFI
jgi:hypothetical protein